MQTKLCHIWFSIQYHDLDSVTLAWSLLPNFIERHMRFIWCIHLNEHPQKISVYLVTSFNLRPPYIKYFQWSESIRNQIDILENDFLIFISNRRITHDSNHSDNTWYIHGLINPLWKSLISSHMDSSIQEGSRIFEI